MIASDLDQDHSDARHRHADEGRDITPIPWGQLLIVLLAQFAEPITGIVIFPFINQFVRETGITGGDETRTGYFAGMIESMFYIAEASTVLLWSMASDRFGRRSIMILGPLGLSLTTLGFGASTQFWSLLMFRFSQGVFNGTIGVSRAVIGEITDKTNVADAFAYVTVMWCIGGIVAPTIGGVFSRPADRWPGTLGKLGYLRDHPYFLPCFIASAVAFVGFMTALVGFKETLPSAVLQDKQRKVKKLQSRSTSSTSLLDDNDGLHYGPIGDNMEHYDGSLTESENSSRVSKPPPLRTLLLMPRVLIAVINYGFFSFCDMKRRVLTPLMWSTSLENGGLGFTPYTIGLTMGISAAVNLVIQAMFLGKAIRYFGARKVFIVSLVTLFVALACFPLEKYIAQRTGGTYWEVWAVVTVQLVMYCMITPAYSAIQVLITESAPCQSSLGTVNGLAQAVGSVSRSLAPSVASSLFAMSLQRNWAGGNAVYYILMGMVACTIRLSFMVPKDLNLP